MKTPDQLKENFYGHEVQTISDLKQCMPMPPTSSKFRRFIMLFLRAHSASSDNYPDDVPGLDCMVYSDDPTESTLNVDFAGQNDELSPDDYPGVYVSFAGHTYEKIAMGNHGGNSYDLSRTDLAKLTHLNIRVSHVAKNDYTASDMAEMSAEILTAMATPMMSHSGAVGFEVTKVGAPTKNKQEPDEYYTVALDIKISYTFRVSRSLESHRIQRVFHLLQGEQ